MENQRNQKPMFASSGSDTDNPFSYATSTTNETMFRRQSCINEANPNSRQEEEPPLLFLHFPSPFLDNGDPLLGHLVPPQQDEIMAGVSCFAESETPPNPKVRLKKRSDHGGGGAKNPNPRKRTGKTDRHSKIYTAHGPRDRRMRLSVQIARKFFDLQDMLGFDKASKTIEWLFSNSKAAIRELTGNVPPQMNYNYNCSRHRGKSVWSLPECEVAPAMEVQRKGILETKGESGTLMGVCVPNEKKRSRKWRKAAYNPRAKESRDKARARARARTRDKMIIRSLVTSKQCLDPDLDLESNTNNLELEQLGSLSPFETAYRLRSRRPENNYPPELMEDIEEQRPHSLEHRLATVGIIERFLGTASASSSTSYSILDFQKLPPVPAVSDGVVDVDHANNSFLGIRGNLDMEGDARINSNYCAALTNVFPLTGNVHGQNPSSTSNIHFQSQFLGNHFSCRPMDGNDSYSLN